MYYYYKLTYWDYDCNLEVSQGIVYGESYEDVVASIKIYYAPDDSNIENLYLENLGDLGAIMELPEDLAKEVVKQIEGQV